MMPHPFARQPAVIDAQLDSLRSLNLDAAQQLTEVRRRIVELEHHELTLIGAIDARQRRMDLLLDERLKAVTA